jgi:hypothetical protein
MRPHAEYWPLHNEGKPVAKSALGQKPKLDLSP